MKEKHPKTGEGDPQEDWQKEFAGWLNSDVAVLAAKLEAVPCMPVNEEEETEETEVDQE